MVRAPFYDKDGVKKGAWNLEEDDKLRACILKYGHSNWRELPKVAGMQQNKRIKLVIPNFYPQFFFLTYLYFWPFTILSQYI